jgi:hypothetical protein
MERKTIKRAERGVNKAEESAAHGLDAAKEQNEAPFRHIYLVTENASHAPKDCFGNYENQEYLYENLNEGLIVSYDIDRCKAYLMTLFPEIINVRSLRFNPYKVGGQRVLASKNAFVAIDLGRNYTNFRAICSRVRTLLGWFTSYIQIRHCLRNGSYMPMTFFNFNGEFVYRDKKGAETTLQEFLLQSRQIVCFSIVVEAAFSERYYQKPGEHLFHVTDTQYASKIERIGLIPRSLGNFPERIYLGRHLKDIRQMVEANLTAMTVFEVDVEGLEIYKDERHPDSFFTYDNIGPSKLTRLN